MTAARIQEALLASGRVPELPRWEPDESTWRRDSALYGYIRTLPAPIDGDRVLRIHQGRKRRSLIVGINKWLAFAILIVLTPSSSIAASAEVTGNVWRELPRAAQLTYVLGVLDAWQIVGPMLSGVAPDEKAAARWFSSIPNCAADKGMTGGQVEAIVRKYVEEKPGEWHRRMAFLVWQAMTEACK